MLDLVETLTADQALKIFKNARVRKYFAPDEQTGCPGGWFEGRVDNAERNLTDEATGETFGLLFHVL